MACCLVLVILVAGPRLAIILLALFTGFFDAAFNALIWLVLGFFFLPFTTLAYAWAINTRGEVAGIQLVVVVAAFLADIGVFSGSERERRRRVA